MLQVTAQVLQNTLVCVSSSVLHSQEKYIFEDALVTITGLQTLKKFLCQYHIILNRIHKLSITYISVYW